jgi:hypothetical protein
VDRFARIVLGYHGCDAAFAEAIFRGEISVAEWKPSRNPYDWLGEGIYFWEHAPARARTWAARGAVVGAVIQLGRCLDLTDVDYTDLLAEEYKAVRAIYRREKRALPKNKGGRRDLDCLVINQLVTSAADEGISFQTVRCPFLEGEPAFPGSGILRESHIQIAVRDKDCILGVFRPHVR